MCNARAGHKHASLPMPGVVIELSQTEILLVATKKSPQGCPITRVIFTPLDN